MKYLEYYKKAMKTGKLLSKNPNGLCYEKGFNKKKLALFEPEEIKNAYWASEITSSEYFDLPDGRERSKSEFGPTRQTIVLFLAALNNEL